MRRAAKVDANHAEIVAALRQVPGVTVQSLAAVGDGVPDILCGAGGKNYLFEIKDPDKPPSARKLTPEQETFHADWRGQAMVIHHAIDAINHIFGKRNGRS